MELAGYMVGWLAGPWPGGPRGEKSGREVPPSSWAHSCSRNKKKNSSINSKTEISAFFFSSTAPCLLSMNPFIRSAQRAFWVGFVLSSKRNFWAKNTPLVYYPPSWMWQAFQGRKKKERKENVTRKFAKNTCRVQSQDTVKHFSSVKEHTK